VAFAFDVCAGLVAAEGHPGDRHPVGADGEPSFESLDHSVLHEGIVRNKCSDAPVPEAAVAFDAFAVQIDGEVAGAEDQAVPGAAEEMVRESERVGDRVTAVV
jgi:hypothetical protein